MTRLFTLFTLSFLLSIPGYAQVNKTIVVEHFTNTRCSVCANRNPGFRTNLGNQNGVLLITFHPSVPYSSCVFNQHNKAENDGRTSYYGILTGTPRLVVQGEVISAGTNYASADIFTPHQNQMTPASLRIEQERIGSDSIEVRVWAKTEATHSLGALRLFVGLSEDTVFYNAPNGESPHYNVFRQSLSGAQGEQIFLSSTVGDSVMFVGKTSMDSEWDANRIFATVILQEEDNKELVQAGAVPASQNDVTTTSIDKDWDLGIRMYPNPAKEQLQIELSAPAPVQAQLYSLLGREIRNFTVQGNHVLNLQDLAPGVYWLSFQDQQGRLTGRKFVKE